MFNAILVWYNNVLNAITLWCYNDIDTIILGYYNVMGGLHGWTIWVDTCLHVSMSPCLPAHVYMYIYI